MIPQSPLEKVARAIEGQLMQEVLDNGMSVERVARAALTALLDPDLIEGLAVVADDAGDKSDHVRICDSRAEFPTEFRAAIQHILKGKADE